MSKPSKTLYGDRFARHDIHLAHAVEDGDAGTEDGGVGGGVDVRGDLDGSFSLEDAVFGD